MGNKKIIVNTPPGIICVNKPPGLTSHDVIYRIRRITGQKAGHTGTLDPEAQGVLPVCIGTATKLAEFISDGDKAYNVEVLFGAETDTQDASGTITREIRLAANTAEVIGALKSFEGTYSQTPPMYSAIQVNGQRLYKLAREGIEIRREPREIQIRHIEVSELSLPERVVITVRCSKGAYMRTLCEDLGRRLSAAAHMGRLIRTEAAGFTLADSHTLESLKALAENGHLVGALIPPEKIPALSGFDRVTIRDTAENRLLNGGSLTPDDVDGNFCNDQGTKVLICLRDKRLAAIYGVSGSVLKPVRMLTPL